MIPVYTAGDLCKKCYSCVRSCPTKAIEVHEGQAQINEAYCIFCGACVNMCSQNAKKVLNQTAEVLELLERRGRAGSAPGGPAASRNGSGGPSPAGPVYAMLAPSFPAAFLDVAPESLAGALLQAGFDGVFEVAFGADVVSQFYKEHYQQLLADQDMHFLISSPCPAVVFYVEKLFPELVPYLSPVVSPMEAMARIVKQRIAPASTVVFIGPCVAKKEEADRSAFVDVALTFSELKELLDGRGIRPGACAPAAFEEPRANLGRIYPVTGGLLKAAGIDDDLIESSVMVVEGPERVGDILKVFSGRVKNGQRVTSRFFDLLFCEGCIGGPDMLNELSFYERKKFIVQYIKNRPMLPEERWRERYGEYLDLDFTTAYSPHDRKEASPTEEEIAAILAMTHKYRPEDELNCGACGYDSCRAKALAVYRGMAEVEMCLPYLIEKVEKTIEDLQENQARLIQAEKLASMGQMAAGIAHEINNPLGVVLMYSHLLREELGSENSNLGDINRIIHEAERTRKIVQGILNFARDEKIERKPADINQLVTQSLDGILKHYPKGKYQATVNLSEELGEQWVDPSQLRQVFDNINKNACEAMPEGGAITVTTDRDAEGFSVTISDTGSGIDPENLSKVFSPFFTTKGAGKGTGLGLPVCYGIIKMHGGSIHAGNNPEGGAFFRIQVKNYVMEESSGKSTHR